MRRTAAKRENFTQPRMVTEMPNWRTWTTGAIRNVGTAVSDTFELGTNRDHQEAAKSLSTPAERSPYWGHDRYPVVWLRGRQVLEFEGILHNTVREVAGWIGHRLYHVPFRVQTK